MKIKIISIGQFKKNILKDVFFYYIHRLPWKITLCEIKPSKNRNFLERKKVDSNNLLISTENSDIVISLDKSGKIISTEKFTTFINDWNYDQKNISFLIGGAEGLTKECLENSRLTVSLGKMTWPHLLVRVMLAEQLYRASTIISKHPYHRK